MKKQVLIIGGNGHGSVIAACIKDNQKNGYDEDIEICGFVNDFVDNVDEYAVLGGTDRIQHFVDEGYYFIWGIHMIGRNVLTEELFKRLNVPLDRLVTIIHYTAFIGENVVRHVSCIYCSSNRTGHRDNGKIQYLYRTRC